MTASHINMREKLLKITSIWLPIIECYFCKSIHVFFYMFLPLLSKLYYNVLLLVYVGTVSLHVVLVYCNAQFQKPSAHI